MMITRAKKELIDNLGVQTADLELDYIRGSAWWKQHTFGEVVRTTGLMSFKGARRGRDQRLHGRELEPSRVPGEGQRGP
eukprot:1140192-Pyramimonas_sp.AAC.1